MSQNHFNRSLPTTQGCRGSASFKWQMRVKIKVTLTNGGWHAHGEAIIIRRADIEHVHDYARVHRKLRDFVLVRSPIKIGLRTNEIRTLNIEDIDFESRNFQVLDSKKKRFYPLPLDVLTLQYIKDLIGDRTEGPVFTREDNRKIRIKHKPLSRVAIWYLFHGIGMEAGVKDFNPRICRHYFACKWIEDMKKPGSKKTIVGLQRILRHSNIATTTFYTARLTFEEDIEQEYHDMQEPYIAHAETHATSQFYRDFCSKCEREPTCKYVDQVASSPWASGCRFYKPKKEMII
jgi:hypothetical protein